MTASSATDRDHAFAAALARTVDARDGRRRLAILRRALGHETNALDTVRVLAAIVPPGTNDHDAEAYELVAALFAIYQRGRPESAESKGDLGASFARLARARGDTGDGAIGRRYAQLLATDRASLGDRMLRAITLLRSQGIAVDWACLAGDVRGWDWPDRPVQRRWARSFISGLDAMVEGPDAAATETSNDQQTKEGIS